MNKRQDVMKYQTVIFDLDGTLLDTSAGVIHATDYIAERYRLPALSEVIKRSFIGPPIQRSFQAHYGCTEEEAWKLATVWREVYKEKFLLEATPYEGVFNLLNHLQHKGIKTCVATNKREDYTQKLLGHFGFLPILDYIVGSDFKGKRSKSEMIHMCIEKTEAVSPREVLMVGDTMGDMIAAQEVGIDFWGVSYGFGFRESDKKKGIQLAKTCQEIQAQF